MNRIWVREGGRLLLGVLGIATLSIVFGYFFLWLALFLLVYVSWLLVNLGRLENWVHNAFHTDPPHATGLWEDIYLSLFRYRKRSQKRQKRLVNRLNRFQEATQALPDAVIVLDSEWVVGWANKSAIVLLGMFPAKDIGQRISNIVRNPLFVAYLEQENFSEPLQISSPADANLTLSIRIVPYGNKQHLLVARDITKLQRLEKVRQDFVANVSHEMRTPLTVINGYLETLCDDRTAPPEMLNLYDQMHQQSARMQSIVNDLLLLAKLESNDTQATHRMMKLDGLFSILREEAESLSGDKHHKIDFDIDKDLMVRGSEAELHSVFSNLVSNAIRYTPDKGTVTVRWYRCGEEGCFEVEDSGIGIARQHIDRLTERFYRVDVGRSRHSGGTGLGLAIVKHVLMRHQAKLKITSEEGVGSKFTCVFPAERINQA